MEGRRLDRVEQPSEREGMDENGGSGSGIVSTEGENCGGVIPTAASTSSDNKPKCLPYSHSLSEALPLRGPRLSARDAAQSPEH